MFDLNSWLRSQTKFDLDYLSLGRKAAKISCLESGDKYKIKWANSTSENHLLRQESIWLARLFRNQKSNEKKSFNGDVFYLFDFYEGDDASKLLAPGQISICAFQNIAYLIYEELIRLHEFGVIHGDVKPQNILLYNKKIRMIDFGSAGWVGNDIHLKMIFSYSEYYSLPNVLSYKKMHADFDWYAFFLILSVFFNGELISLKTTSQTEFFYKCMFFLDELKLDRQDKLFLERALSSIINNQPV